MEASRQRRRIKHWRQARDTNPQACFQRLNDYHLYVNLGRSLCFPHLRLWVLPALLCAETSVRPANISPWSVRSWQTEEELPEVNVTGLAQTPEGYLWIATHGGLARFDGLRFQLQPLPVVSVRSNALIRARLLIPIP